MNKQIIKSDLLGESYIQVNHKSGLTILLYPMPSYSGAYATFGTKYGSIDTKFKNQGTKILPKYLQVLLIFLSINFLKMKTAMFLNFTLKRAHREMLTLLLIKQVTFSLAPIILKILCLSF